MSTIPQQLLQLVLVHMPGRLPAQPHFFCNGRLLDCRTGGARRIGNRRLRPGTRLGAWLGGLEWAAEGLARWCYGQKVELGMGRGLQVARDWREWREGRHWAQALLVSICCQSAEVLPSSPKIRKMCPCIVHWGRLRQIVVPLCTRAFSRESTAILRNM